MTAPVGLVDLEEDDRFIPIDRSHLAEGECECGNVAFHARGQRVRCGACRRADADAGPGVAPAPRVLPLLGQGYPPHPTAGREDYPAPEFTSRSSAIDLFTPGPVVKLAEKARKAGWRVRVQTSRG